MVPTIRAVATEIVVNPARTATNWRPPKGSAEKTADDPSGNRSNRTRNQQARACSGSGADHVGASDRRNRRDCDDGRGC